MKHSHFFTALLLNSGVIFAYGQAGALDPTFGNNGIVTTAYQGNSEGQDIAIQSDGKIVVVGSTEDTIQILRLNRYLSDGTLDNSFGTGGTATIDSFFSMGNAVIIQPDGKIVVAGNAFSTSANAHVLVVRFNTDGTLDNSFGTAGIVTTPVGNYGNVIRDVALQVDGKIVVGGTSFVTPVTDMLLLRYNADGSIDSSFGTGGKRLIGSSNLHDDGKFVLIQNDGKILIGGMRHGTNIPADIEVARVHPNGTTDVSFGTNGIVLTDVSGASDWAKTGAIQNDGKLVIGGFASVQLSNVGVTPHFCVLRYNTNGSLDMTFNGIGIVLDMLYANNNFGNALQIQSNGSIVLAGKGWDRFLMARYTPAGIVDSTFGVNGHVVTDIASGEDVCYALAIQSDTMIVLCGSSVNGSGIRDFALARYGTGTASIDELSNDFGEVSVHPNPVRANSVLTYTLMKSDEVSIQLYSMDGRLLQTILNGENQSNGEKTIELELKEDLSAGIYMILIKSSSASRIVQIYKE